MKFKAKHIHIALIGYCLLIFGQSSIPGDKLPKTDFEFSDKIIHIAIYFILYILFFYSLKYQTKSIKLHSFSFEFAFLFTVLYGISDELHQYFVPNRSCEFYDLLADITGAVLGYFTVKYFLLKRVNIAVILILILFTGCSTSEKNYKPESADMVKMYITEGDCWFDKMPGPDIKGNKLRFLISVTAESDKKPESFDIRNFTVYLNNDTLKNQSFEKEIFKSSNDITNINITHDMNNVYIDPGKPVPTEAKFEFDVFINNVKAGSIKTGKLKILNVY